MTSSAHEPLDATHIASRLFATRSNAFSNSLFSHHSRLSSTKEAARLQPERSRNVHHVVAAGAGGGQGEEALGRSTFVR